MIELARILIADDEETFLQSTADLLRREGYRCDCVLDAQSAIQMFGDNEYDLLISDIKMPGNSGLELIQNISDTNKNTPVVLITAYPVLSSAIHSLELRVTAYLIKPIDFSELLQHVVKAVEQSSLYRSVHSIKERLQYWYEGLEDIEHLLQDKSPKALPVSVNAFIELTFQNIAGAMSDLKHLARKLTIPDASQEACHLFNCPRLNVLTEQVVGTIDVLKRSKGAFKSKELGQIRKKLQEVIATEV